MNGRKLVSGALMALLVMAFVPLSSEGYSMDERFLAKDWKAVDALVAGSGATLSPREESLAANALWFQGRWGEALALLEKGASAWPEEVAPYGTMMTILALERTKRPEEAVRVAEKLLPLAPPEIGYYVAYALYRLSDEKDVKSRRKYLERMDALSVKDQQRTTALTNLLRLPGDKRKHALDLLDIHPQNAAALKVLEALPKPWDTEVSFALGYAAYLRGEYAKAVPLLKAVPLDSRNGRKARYYRAYGQYRRKKHSEALELWSILARSGMSYAESSVRRISILAGQAERERALRVLREVAASREGAVQVQAYYSLSTNLSGKEKREAEEKVLALAPDSDLAARIHWERGWNQWRDGNIGEAVEAWEKSRSSPAAGNWRPRILHWLAEGYGRLGREKSRDETLRLLGTNYPLSVYGILANKGTVEIQPGGVPSLGGTVPSALESWGFLHYARMQYEAAGDTKSLYRAARIAEWIGDGESVYTLAGRLSGTLTKGPLLYREALELLYPRPFMKEVRSAAERFGVEDNFVWAVMRQESAFNPNATSWVGAAGLMQLMPATAKSEAASLKMDRYNLYNPGQNILLGTAHIARLMKSFEREELAAAAYNAGSGAVRRWLGEREDVPLGEWIEAVRYEETNGYVQKVMANLAVYRALASGEEPDALPAEEPFQGDGLPVDEDDPAIQRGGAPKGSPSR